MSFRLPLLPRPARLEFIAGAVRCAESCRERYSVIIKCITPNKTDCCPLLAVVGPTGSGKSSLALHLAERFRGEIVNCDSVQIYRYFDIGSARTPVAERRGITHHLMDVCEPDEVFTAGDYL